MRSSTIIIILAAIAGMAGFLLGGWLSMKPSDTLREGSRYEDFSRFDVDGRQWRLSELEGRVVLLNFWATWCPPCVHELPMLGRLQRQLEGQGLSIVGIAEDDPDRVRQFLDRHPADFLHLLETPGGGLGRRYGNLRSVLPFSVLIDRQGQIVWRKYGMLEEAELSARLQAVLAPQ